MCLQFKKKEDAENISIHLIYLKVLYFALPVWYRKKNERFKQDLLLLYMHTHSTSFILTPYKC